MTPPSEPIERLHGLDALRAAMMLLGLVLHGTISYGTIPFGAAWPLKDDDQSFVCDVVVLTIHVFRMPVFFVMAGFFAALLVDRRGVASFTRNRLSRIGLPFILGLVVLFPLTKAGAAFALTTQAEGRAAGWEAARVILTTPAAYTGLKTIHMWFLWYLLHYYVMGIVLRRAASLLSTERREALQARFRHMVESGWRFVIPALVTAATLWPMRSAAVDTETGFIVSPRVLVAYFVFFSFGWLLYAQRDLLPRFERRAGLQCLLGGVASFAAMAAGAALRDDPGSVGLRAVATAAGGFGVWLLAYGMIGLFIRWCGKESPVIRYVVDSSYWLYLFHLPFCFWLPGLILDWDASALIKATLVLVMMTPALFVSYHLLVRATWVGVLLNGRRYPATIPFVRGGSGTPVK